MGNDTGEIDIFRISRLARLDLSQMANKDVEELASQLRQFVTLAGLIKKASSEIDQLDPLYHPHDLSQPLREDVAKPTPIKEYRDKLLANAPHHDEENYLVPRVLD